MDINYIPAKSSSITDILAMLSCKELNLSRNTAQSVGIVSSSSSVDDGFHIKAKRSTIIIYCLMYALQTSSVYACVCQGSPHKNLIMLNT